MELNWYIILATGLVPLAVGAVWYGPLFGKAWMTEAEMSVEKMQGANMAKIFGISAVLGLLLAVGLTPIVVHQMGVFSTLLDLGVDQPGTEAHTYFMEFMTKHGQNFRTFKHGVLHGGLTGIFIFLPIMATNALFERKSWKYIILNLGYWTVSAMIMGGIISAFA